MPPPSSVLKALQSVIVCGEVPEQRRKLSSLLARSKVKAVTIQCVRYQQDAEDPDEKAGVLCVGFNAAVAKSNVPIFAIKWRREFAKWDAIAISWLLVLLLHKASDVLPRLGETVRAIIHVHYKWFPAHVQSETVAVKAAIKKILATDKRFATAQSCLQTLAALAKAKDDELDVLMVFNDGSVDQQGDPAVMFDIGPWWIRAAELLQLPVADRREKPGVRYLVGEEDSYVMDGKTGLWHDSLRAYVHARLEDARARKQHSKVKSAEPMAVESDQSVLPPRFQSAEARQSEEFFNVVVDMMLALSSAKSLGVSDSKFGLYGPSGEDILLSRARGEAKDPSTKALRQTYRTYGIFIPEMGAAGLCERACAGCEMLEPSNGPKFATCSRCGLARYCSAQCQKAHWKSHKQDCRAANAQGGTTTDERPFKSRIPSKAAILAQLKSLDKPPLPGSEEAAAWKAAMSSFLSCGGELSLGEAERNVFHENLQDYKRREALFGRQFPDRPNWENYDRPGPVPHS